ncbi:MAG: hypothetical protein RL417_357 [Pseudomonadota bacterium]|jgi:rhomboid protease GluP
MNFNLVCLAIVVVLCLGVVVRYRRIPLAEGFVLFIAGFGELLFPVINGVLALGFWFALIGIPGWLLGGMTSALVCGDYLNAARKGRWVGRLHPYKRWRERARGVCSLADSVRGDGMRGAAEHTASELRLLNDLDRGALAGEWRVVTSLAQTVIRGGAREATPLILYLRALGELGELTKLDYEFLAVERALGGEARAMARLLVGAFHGEAVLVRCITEEHLAAMHPDLKRFWIATALELCGNREEAARGYEALSASSIPGIRESVHRRLAEAAAPAPPLRPELRAYIGAAVEDESRYGDTAGAVGPATNLLFWLIAGVFAVELIVGQGALFFEWGAFWPTGILVGGEWWRIITPLFLHLGVAHVAFNALALRSLGPFVERSLGVSRFLLVFFGAGCGGLLLILLGVRYLGFEERIVVGASGSIMGLVGATGAILHCAALRERSPVAHDRLRSIGVIIGLQVVFDILVPQTSAAAHLIGAALGYLIGRVFYRR